MKKMQFAPVVEDDDEISQLIKGDVDEHDNNWQLKEDLDGEKLAAFWDAAVRELDSQSDHE